MAKQRPPALPKGLYYYPRFINRLERENILTYLSTLYPIWEERYTKNFPPPEGDTWRPLLRPVYWLGNWQFACLGYYHPPEGILHRSVRAEPYPPELKDIVKRVEEITRRLYPKEDIPKGWELNTCLINFYGDREDKETGKKNDYARVGEHKDFEPGPVASISIGERALFQFVKGKKHLKDNEVLKMWLDDSSLKIFGGKRFKDDLFHRVQRVDRKTDFHFPLNEIDDFYTRRINFTFRYVPRQHIYDYANLPAPAKEDTIEHIKRLALHSEFFKNLKI